MKISLPIYVTDGPRSLARYTPEEIQRRFKALKKRVQARKELRDELDTVFNAPRLGYRLPSMPRRLNPFPVLSRQEERRLAREQRERQENVRVHKERVEMFDSLCRGTAERARARRRFLKANGILLR